MEELDLERLVYLDNAATTYPKPPEVLEAMLDLYRRYGVNPGRSGYDLCLAAERYVGETRAALTRLLGGTDPERLSFAANGSDALNVLIQGLVRDGDHVVTTTLEHNSVLRPLAHLHREHRVAVDHVRCGSDGVVDPAEIAARFRRGTRAAVVTHGSNVLGTVQPVAEIGRLCRERGVLLIVDAAQTAGLVPVDVEAMAIDALAFTGHKSLLGPTGTGGTYVRPGLDVRQTRFGGTGVESAHPYHLERHPYRLEVGTANLLGVLGLHAALAYIERRGMQAIHRHEMELLAALQAGLSEIPRVRLLGTTRLEERLPLLSFTVEDMDPADVGAFLDVDHDVAVRTGLHCAPLVHAELGTAPRGAVRMSLGPLNSAAHVAQAIAAVAEIAAAGLRSPRVPSRSHP